MKSQFKEVGIVLLWKSTAAESLTDKNVRSTSLWSKRANALPQNIVMGNWFDDWKKETGMSVYQEWWYNVFNDSQYGKEVLSKLLKAGINKYPCMVFIDAENEGITPLFQLQPENITTENIKKCLANIAALDKSKGHDKAPEGTTYQGEDGNGTGENPGDDSCPWYMPNFICNLSDYRYLPYALLAGASVYKAANSNKPLSQGLFGTAALLSGSVALKEYNKAQRRIKVRNS